MSKVIDCRGLSCPHPVIQTKQALEESDKVTTVVDNPVSRDNVARFGESQGCEVTIEAKEDAAYIHIVKKTAVEGESDRAPTTTPATGPLVLIIPHNQMGRGNEELGGILMRSFLHTLGEVSPLPQTVIFFNAGVKLTVEGSEVLGDLQTLEQQGINILVCGTCLDYFGLKEKIAVGQISNMYTIAETMLGAGRLVTV